METVLTLVTWVIVAATFFVARQAYPFLPARIPIHFGFRGEPDGWGSRKTIWLLPIISAVMVAFLTALPAIDDIKKAGLLLVVLNLEMAAMYFVIMRDQIDVALGRRMRLGVGVWIMLALTCLTPLLFIPALSGGGG